MDEPDILGVVSSLILSWSALFELLRVLHVNLQVLLLSRCPVGIASGELVPVVDIRFIPGLQALPDLIDLSNNR